jgi:hypothetical protein
MLTLTKKLFAGIAIVIVVLIVSITLLGQVHPKKNNSGNHTYDSSYWNTNVPEKYWLNDDQISQADKIRAEYDVLIQPEIEKYNSVRDDYSAYRQQNEISRERIKEYQTELRNIEDNIYSLKMEAANKIRNVFSKVQRPYYNNYIYNDWCDDWGWNYDGYMDYGMKDNRYMDCGWGWDYDSGMKKHGRMCSHSGCW